MAPKRGHRAHRPNRVQLLRRRGVVLTQPQLAFLMDLDRTRPLFGVSTMEALHWTTYLDPDDFPDDAA